MAYFRISFCFPRLYIRMLTTHKRYAPRGIRYNLLPNIIHGQCTQCTQQASTYRNFFNHFILWQNQSVGPQLSIHIIHHRLCKSSITPTFSTFRNSEGPLPLSTHRTRRSHVHQRSVTYGLRQLRRPRPSGNPHHCSLVNIGDHTSYITILHSALSSNNIRSMITKLTMLHRRHQVTRELQRSQGYSIHHTIHSYHTIFQLLKNHPQLQLHLQLTTRVLKHGNVTTFRMIRQIKLFT